MAWNAAHWTITRADGNVRYIGPNHVTGGSYVTVIDFHRELQAFADDASSAGDDELDITDENPSARSTDNIVTLLGNYNIDQTASEHIYDGSIVQGGGDDIWDGIVNYGNSSILFQLLQNGAVSDSSTAWWNDNGGAEAGGLNADATQGISHRFMIKTRTTAADVDGRRLIGLARTFGNTYAEFSINGTARGNNVLALVDADDLNNNTVVGTVAGWTSITNTTEGYANIDVDSSGADEFYYSEWNTNQPTRTINEFYERMKWLTEDSTTPETTYGLAGNLFRGITHQIAVDTITSGPLNAFEELTWDGGASSAQMFATDSVAAPTTIWIQLLTGILPTDGETLTGGTSSATVDVNVTITPRTLSVPFMGVSTGSAIIGAYGFGVEAADLTDADKVFDLTNTQYSPPIIPRFTVGGLTSGEDRVMVAPWDGVTNDAEGFPAIEKDQLILTTDLIGATETAVVVTTAIPTDTPAAGTIRVQLDTGFLRYIAYTSWTGSTFTTASTDWTDPDDATGAAEVFISYLDVTATGTTEFFDAVYKGTDSDLVVIVRDGGGSPIKQFIQAAVFSATDTTVSAIHTVDT